MGVRSFLASHEGFGWLGGAPCATCRHKNRKKIERAMLEYKAAVEAGETSVPARTFVRMYVRPEFNFRHDIRSLAHHMENHLGKKR